MGRQFADEFVQHDMQNLPYIIEERDGKPIVKVTFRGETRGYVSPRIPRLLSVHQSNQA